MRALLTDEENLIAETIRRMTGEGRSRARRALKGEVSDEPSMSLASEWWGLGIPEERGGQGGSLVAAALLMQELGRSLEPTSFATSFVARHALSASAVDVGPFAQRNLACDFAGTVALTGSGAVGVLEGVPGAQDPCVIVCRTDGEVLAVTGRCEPLPTGDPLRVSARVKIDGEPLARGPDLRSAQAAGTLLIAAELCGVGRGALQLAVDYAKERVQFGRPIGSYQAIAHRLAEASADLEAAWSLVLYGCSLLEAQSRDLERAVHAAKASAGDAALAAADACVQTHGGMGITYEADPHLFLRRALFDDAWFGSAPTHRRELGQLMIGPRS